MHEVHLQFTEQLYTQAWQRAMAAGFASLEEYIVDVVSEDVAHETENFDHLFTPEVVTHLNQIQEEIKSGATTYTEAQIDEHFKERAREWRESHAS